MPRHFTFLRIVVLPLLFIAPSLARAQALADRVPADAIIYLGWQGIESPGPGFKGSNLEAVLADSSLNEVFDDFLPKVLERFSEENTDAEQVVTVLREFVGPMWRHPSAFAFSGIDANSPNGPAIKVMLLCQAGKESAAMQKQLQTLLAQNPSPVPIQIVRADDLLIVCSGYDKPQDAVIKAGQKGASLANHPSFVKALSHVGKDPVMTGYVDVEKALALADMAAGFAGPEIQKNWADARNTLGLSGVKAAIWTQGFDGKAWGTQGFVAAPAPRKGIVGAMLEGKPLSQAILDTIPKNATVAGAAHFDIAGLINALRSAAATLDPNVGRQIDQNVDLVNKELGLDIQKDFLESLGDEWAYYSDPAVAGDGVVGTTLVNRLKNPARMAQSLAKLEALANRQIRAQLKTEREKVTLEVRQARVGSITVHYLGIPLFTPSWAIADGNLYMGMYPEIVAAAAGHVQSKGEPISANPAFTALFKHLGGQPGSSFQYVDLARRAPQTYSSWLVLSHLANIGDLLNVPAPMFILPPLGKLLPHLSPAGSTTWTDAEGVHFRALTPFPGSAVFAADPMSFGQAEAPLMMSILLPSLNRAREHANRVKSASNLRQIGLAALMYANGHNGSLPRDFAELLKTQDLVPSLLLNPRTTTTIPPGLSVEQQLQWVAEHGDYVWNGAGKKNTMSSEEPLAWEKLEGASEGISILFGDTHVEWVTLPRAREIIQKAQAENPVGHPR